MYVVKIYVNKHQIKPPFIDISGLISSFFLCLEPFIIILVDLLEILKIDFSDITKNILLKRVKIKFQGPVGPIQPLPLKVEI